MNPRSCKIRLQGIGEAGDVALVDPGTDNFRDYVKLPGKGETEKAYLTLERAGFGKTKDLRDGLEGKKEKEGVEIEKVEGIGCMLSRKEKAAR